MFGFRSVLTLLAVLCGAVVPGLRQGVAEGFGAFNQRVKVVSIVRDVDMASSVSAASCANSRFRATRI